MRLNNKLSAIQRAGNQRGSAIIYVLLGIALFAAVMFAVSRSNNSGSANIMSKGNSKAQASAILDYAQSVQTAVQKLIAKGCSENEISFENPVYPAYVNLNSPNDKSCHVFQNLKANSGWGFLYRNTFDGAGCNTVTNRDCVDLVLVYKLTKNSNNLNLCNAVNKILGLDLATPPVENSLNGSAGFTGSFAVDEAISGTNISGRSSGCFDGRQVSDSKNYYWIYQILLAR